MAISAINHWVKPGECNEATEKFITSGPGTKDVLEAVSTTLGWFPYFNLSEETLNFSQRIKSDIEPIAQGLSLFSFFNDANSIRRKIGHYRSTDDPNASTEIFKKTMNTVTSGSESVMFFDTIDLIQLKEGMKVAKGAFWGSLGLFCGVELFEQIGEVEHWNKEAKLETDKEKKVVQESLAELSSLRVLKNVITVALASIMLVSLFFAGASSYLIFSPIVTLSLSTVGFVLLFVNYYYSENIKLEREHLKALGKSV